MLWRARAEGEGQMKHSRRDHTSHSPQTDANREFAERPLAEHVQWAVLALIAFVLIDYFRLKGWN
jgi:hypothetical protein